MQYDEVREIRRFGFAARWAGPGLVVVAVLSVGALWGGCGADEGESCPSGRFRCLEICLPTPVASLEYVQAEVFDRQCNIRLCHGRPESAIEEDLRLYDEQTSYDELVNVESVQRDGAILVVPSSSAQSYLMNKLTGIDMADRSSVGEPTEIMPNGQGELCQEQIDVVQQWIDNGAPR